MACPFVVVWFETHITAQRRPQSACKVLLAMPSLIMTGRGARYHYTLLGEPLCPPFSCTLRNTQLPEQGILLPIRYAFDLGTSFLVFVRYSDLVASVCSPHATGSYWGCAWRRTKDLVLVSARPGRPQPLPPPSRARGRLGEGP